MKGYIFDLDGTLYRGSEPLPHAVDTICRLHGEGKAIAYMTNNSSLTREDQARKLVAMGFPCAKEQVWPSSVAAAGELKRRGLCRIFVVGETGLEATLEEFGLKPTRNNPDAVLAGIYRSLDYDRLCGALAELSAGVPFFATNTDATYPLEAGRVEPGAGAIVAYLERASGQRAHVCGKPNPRAFLDVVEVLGLKPSEILVVGDRYETDIEGGKAIGCLTWLVLTGVTKMLPEGQIGSATLLDLP